MPGRNFFVRLKSLSLKYTHLAPAHGIGIQYMHTSSLTKVSAALQTIAWADFHDRILDLLKNTQISHLPKGHCNFFEMSWHLSISFCATKHWFLLVRLEKVICLSFYGWKGISDYRGSSFGEKISCATSIWYRYMSSGRVPSTFQGKIPFPIWRVLRRVGPTNICSLGGWLES